MATGSGAAGGTPRRSPDAGIQVRAGRLWGGGVAAARGQPPAARVGDPTAHPGIDWFASMN